VLASRDFFDEHVVKLTVVLGQLCSVIPGEFPRVGEHEHDRTRGVLGCAQQSNYRTSYSGSAAETLWIFRSAGFFDVEALIPQRKFTRLNGRNQKWLLYLAAKIWISLEKPSCHVSQFPAEQLRVPQRIPNRIEAFTPSADRA